MDAMTLYGNEMLKAKPLADVQNKIAKNAPEILLVTGVVGVIVGTVLACRATLKAQPVVDQIKTDFDDIQVYREKSLNPDTDDDPIEYSDEDYRKDLVIASMQAAKNVTKLYGVSALVMAGSIFCIFKGHGITVKRNEGLTAAVAVLSAGYNAYRVRVREAVGEEAENDIFRGMHEETIEVTDAKGKVTKKKVKVSKLDIPSTYARYFDDQSRQWQPSPELNLTFLRCQQNYANDKLRINKVLFLNEVYEMLGLERTQAGTVVGWAITDDGDNYVDFGLFDNDTFQKRRFINGDEMSVLLDFNVNGVVYDLL